MIPDYKCNRNRKYLAGIGRDFDDEKLVQAIAPIMAEAMEKANMKASVEQWELWKVQKMVGIRSII
ncbi:hypothetical protein AALB39_03510 [Lachnospiraceae bacterium 54-53]